MKLKSPIVAAVAIAIGYSILPSAPKAMAEDVPGALAVEWEGKKPCELLYEDDYVRVARCTFAKGATHTCHTHPSYLLYTISGGEGTVQDEKGTRKVEAKAGTFTNVTPVPWHVFSNAGDSTIQYLVIEKKYQPATALDISACPKG
jgi:quercetin dioxygenase-like cupin family protein